MHDRVIRIGREALPCLLARRGITFQRTKTGCREHVGRAAGAHKGEKIQTRALQVYLRWRNANARHRDVLAAFKDIGPRDRPSARAATMVVRTAVDSGAGRRTVVRVWADVPAPARRPGPSDRAADGRTGSPGSAVRRPVLAPDGPPVCSPGS